MQEEVNKILEWAKTWKMEINQDWTKAMVISSSKADQDWDIGLLADNVKMETVKQYRFLEVLKDNGFYFEQQFKWILENGTRRNRVIKALAHKDWGNSLEVQKTIYL